MLQIAFEVATMACQIFQVKFIDERCVANLFIWIVEFGVSSLVQNYYELKGVF